MNQKSDRTALAKLPEKWREEAKFDASTPEESGYKAALLDCIDELTAALSPAEPGGVLAKAIYDPNSGRASEVDRHDWPNSAGFINVLIVRADESTPRTAEAVTEEMVERACIEDASGSYPYTWDHLPDSVKVRRRKRMAEILASALTPPSAKGENSNV